MLRLFKPVHGIALAVLSLGVFGAGCNSEQTAPPVGGAANSGKMEPAPTTSGAMDSGKMDSGKMEPGTTDSGKMDSGKMAPK